MKASERLDRLKEEKEKLASLSSDISRKNVPEKKTASLDELFKKKMAEKIPEEKKEKAEKKEGGKKFNTSIMKAIAGIYGGGKKEEKTGFSFQFYRSSLFPAASQYFIPSSFIIGTNRTGRTSFRISSP